MCSVIASPFDLIAAAMSKVRRVFGLLSPVSTTLLGVVPAWICLTMDPAFITSVVVSMRPRMLNVKVGSSTHFGLSRYFFFLRLVP